jgi:hypothetical protein
MKILLKQSLTGLWLKPFGRWEPNSIGACEVTSSHGALLASQQSGLSDLSFCFHFDDKQLNFEMPAQRAF